MVGGPAGGQEGVPVGGQGVDLVGGQGAEDEALDPLYRRAYPEASGTEEPLNKEYTV